MLFMFQINNLNQFVTELCKEFPIEFPQLLKYLIFYRILRAYVNKNPTPQ